MHTNAMKWVSPIFVDEDLSSKNERILVLESWLKSEVSTEPLAGWWSHMRLYFPCFDTFIVALFCSSADWWLLILFGALAGCKLKHIIYTQYICIVSYVTCFNHDTDTNATLLSAIMTFNKSGTGKPGQVLIHQVNQVQRQDSDCGFVWYWNTPK